MSLSPEWIGVAVAAIIGGIGIVISLNANRKADEAMGLTRQIQDEHLRLTAPVLTVTNIEVDAHGTVVTIHNSGETRADNVIIDFVSAGAAAWSVFEPRPLRVIEARGDGRFGSGATRDEYLSGKIISSDIRIRWQSPLGQQEQQVCHAVPTIFQEGESIDRD